MAEARPAPPVWQVETVQIADPRPPKRSAFALTPLADVMFQLLIFFMLSSTLAPYALVPLSPATAQTTRPTESQTAQGGGSESRVIWHVGRGEVRSGQASLPLADLPPALEALKAEGLEEVLVFTTPAATAQDVATVLEAIQVSRVARVRLIGRPGGG